MPWITTSDVKAYLGINTFDTVDDDHLELCTAAAIDYVAGLRTDLDPGDPVGDQVKLGLVMLAAAVYDRRGSQGDASVADWAGPGPVLDGTVQQLLGLGRWHAPVIS